MSTITVTCPHCNKSLEADSSFSEQTVECPACGKTFSMPELRKLRLASAGTARPKNGKGKLVAMILLSIFALITVVFVLGSLRVGWFQHEEEADDPRVLAAEEALLFDFAAQHGEWRLEDFMRTTWDEKTSRWYRTWEVPWAVFKSQDERIEARIKTMTHYFYERSTEYFELLQCVRENCRINGKDRKFRDDELEAAWREMKAEEENRPKEPHAVF